MKKAKKKKKRRGKHGGADGPLWYEARGWGCSQVFSPAGAAFLSEGGQDVSDEEIKMLKNI